MAKQTGKRSWRWSWPLGAALALGSIVATGCDSDGSPFITSLQPFYTQLDLEADSRLNGMWSNKEGDVTFSFEERMEEGKAKEYKLVVMERDGEQEMSGEFEARVVRLGAFDFMDIYPQSSKEGNEFYRAHFYTRAYHRARGDQSELDPDGIFERKVAEGEDGRKERRYWVREGGGYADADRNDGGSTRGGFFPCERRWSVCRLSVTGEAADREGRAMRFSKLECNWQWDETAGRGSRQVRATLHAWTSSRRLSVGSALMDFPTFSWASRRS